MKITRLALINRGVWTIGAYGASVSLKLLSNIILSRLLAPEIFGIMVIVSSIKLGIELFSDVGVEQNIVHNRKGLEAEFLNTAWAVQVVRGLGLTVLFLALSPVFAWFYNVDLTVFLIISIAPFLNSLASTSIFVQLKNQDVKGRNIFELVSECLALVITVGLALITPTVWALVTGAVLSVAVRAGISHLIPPRVRLAGFNWTYAREIIRFGKWILVTSFLVYAAGNIDRIYLGKIVPLQVLGLYGLARTIADLPKMLANRLSYQIVFPVIAALKTSGRPGNDPELRASRLSFVLPAALLLGSFTAWSDWAIMVMYDPRYHDAGWMLFVLMLGGWISVLSSSNEAVLLGLGAPAYNSLPNGVRLAVLAVGLPVSYAYFGLVGAIGVVAGSEAFRYGLIAVLQKKCGVSFVRQDVLATLVLVVAIGGWVLVRQSLGLGVPWAGALGGSSG